MSQSIYNDEILRLMDLHHRMCKKFDANQKANDEALEQAQAALCISKDTLTGLNADYERLKAEFAWQINRAEAAEALAKKEKARADVAEKRAEAAEALAKKEKARADSAEESAQKQPQA